MFQRRGAETLMMRTTQRQVPMYIHGYKRLICLELAGKAISHQQSSFPACFRTYISPLRYKYRRRLRARNGDKPIYRGINSVSRVQDGAWPSSTVHRPRPSPPLSLPASPRRGGVTHSHPARRCRRRPFVALAEDSWSLLAPVEWAASEGCRGEMYWPAILYIEYVRTVHGRLPSIPGDHQTAPPGRPPPTAVI